MATAPKKPQPATHFTVWVGLGLAVLGLLLALYAYSGTRIYDVTYAFVAVAGGVMSLVGILVSAWGRSIMAARAQRSKRATIQKDALKLAEAVADERPPPTVAEPPEKKRFSLGLPKRKAKEAAPPVEGQASSGTIFAFRRSSAPPPAPEPEIPAVEALVEKPLDLGSPTAVPVAERVTLKCPSCSAQFAAEGVRPFAATCPSCGFSATI